MTLRVAVIGAGEIAQLYHLKALRRLQAERGDLALAGIADLVLARAEQCAKAYGFEAAFEDHNDLVHVARPDVVYVLASYENVSAILGDLLPLGLPLFIEKPPGNSAAEAAASAAQAERCGTPTFVAFNRRWMPLVRKARELMSALGPVVQVDAELARTGRDEPRFLYATAIHGLDLLRYLAGEPREAQVCRPAAAPPDIAAQSVRLRFASGALGHLSILPQAGISIERVRLYGREWALHLFVPLEWTIDYPGWLELHRQNENSLVIDNRGMPQALLDPAEICGFYGESAYCLDCAARGLAPRPGLGEALASVQLADCVQRGVDYAPDAAA
jgi:virulence factor